MHVVIQIAKLTIFSGFQYRHNTFSLLLSAVVIVLSLLLFPPHDTIRSIVVAEIVIKTVFIS